MHEIQGKSFVRCESEREKNLLWNLCAEFLLINWNYRNVFRIFVFPFEIWTIWNIAIDSMVIWLHFVTKWMWWTKFFFFESEFSSSGKACDLLTWTYNFLYLIETPNEKKKTERNFDGWMVNALASIITNRLWTVIAIENDFKSGAFFGKIVYDSTWEYPNESCSQNDAVNFSKFCFSYRN